MEQPLDQRSQDLTNLQASAQRFRALVHATSDVVYCLSPDWEIMYPLDGRGFLKDAHLPTTGWKEINVYHGDLEMVDAAIAQAINTKATFALEHRVNRVDGSTGWTFSRAVPILDERGEIIEWFGAASDITARKLAEHALTETNNELQDTNEEMAATNEEIAAANEELLAANEELTALNEQLLDARQRIQESEHSLRLALDAASLGTWSLHPATGNLQGDARFGDLLGRPQHQGLSSNMLTEHVPLDHRGNVEKELQEATGDKGYLDMSFPITVKNEQGPRWLRMIGRLSSDRSWRLPALTGVMADITQQKDEELRKNDFIAMVAHELRTPLTSIKGYVQVLLRRLGGAGDEFTTGALERTGSQIERMAEMIDGFLNLSRLESGRIAIHLHPFEITGLLDEAIEECRATIASHQVFLDRVEPAIVLADRYKIAQVIHNLVSNAVKYSPAGTNIYLSCKQGQGVAQVSVTDQGMGIAPGNLAKVFERYFRAHDTKNTAIPGFGIGLYLCRELISGQGGRIWAQSDQAIGSTFHFTLPLARQPDGLPAEDPRDSP